MPLPSHYVVSAPGIHDMLQTNYPTGISGEDLVIDPAGSTSYSLKQVLTSQLVSSDYHPDAIVDTLTKVLKSTNTLYPWLGSGISLKNVSATNLVALSVIAYGVQHLVYVDGNSGSTTPNTYIGGPIFVHEHAIVASNTNESLSPYTAHSSILPGCTSSLKLLAATCSQGIGTDNYTVTLAISPYPRLL